MIPWALAQAARSTCSHGHCLDGIDTCSRGPRSNQLFRCHCHIRRHIYLHFRCKGIFQVSHSCSGVTNLYMPGVIVISGVIFICTSGVRGIFQVSHSCSGVTNLYMSGVIVISGVIFICTSGVRVFSGVTFLFRCHQLIHVRCHRHIRRHIYLHFRCNKGIFRCHILVQVSPTYTCQVSSSYQASYLFALQV